MHVLSRIGSMFAFGAALAGSPLASHSAHAAKAARGPGHVSTHVSSHVSSPGPAQIATFGPGQVARRAIASTGASGRGHGGSKHLFAKGTKARYGRYASAGGLQCVPFARAASGIALKGNAANWWDAAAGVYDRGAAPEAGSVLNFRATGRMRLGHVAVVTAIDDSRHIEVEHANWPGTQNKSGISKNILVEDVSDRNDWSAVKVGLGNGDYGSTYPTYGFIYDRPDTGTDHGTGNGVRYAVRPARFGGTAPQDVPYDEVAQAPEGASRGRHVPSVFDDTPQHSFK